MMNFYKEDQGSIAIYLSVIFLSMIILAAVITDAACIHTAQIHAARSADIAARSILSEYDQNLKNEYGLFAFHGSQEEIGQKVYAYANRMLNPDFNVDEEYVDFYDFKVEAVQIQTEDVSLNNMDILEPQILEYMKYRAVLGALFDFSKEIEGIKKAGNGLELMNKAKVVYEETKKLEEELNNLRKYSDGWSYKKDGFQPYTNSIKSLCISKGKNGKDQYFNNLLKLLAPSQKEILTHHLIDISSLKELNDAYLKEYDEYAYLCSVVEGLKGAKSALNLEDEEDNRLYRRIHSTLRKYKNKLRKCEVQDELAFYIDRENACNRAIKSIDFINLTGQHILDLIHEIENYIEDMGDEIIIELTDSIKSDVTSIKHAIGDGFGSNLLDAKEKIIENKELLKWVEENFIEYRSLQQLEEEGYDIGRRFGNEWDKNDFLDEIEEMVEKDRGYNSAKKNFEVACEKLVKEYESDFLVEVFSLKNLKPQSSQENVLDMEDIENAEDEEPTYHTLDSNRVLKNEHLISMLPTSIYGIDPQPLVDIEALANISLESFSTKNIINKLYIDEYVISNFNYHTAPDKIEETFYQHEVEYVLYGKYDESKNFSDFQRDVFLLRMAMNLMHIYTDPTKKQQTLDLATGITAPFGGAGLFQVQFLVASAWAGAEAKIDLDELVAGENTPFVKNKDNWNLAFESFSTGKRKKSAKIDMDKTKEPKDPIPSNKINELNYEDYLRLFLLLRDKEKVLYRTLDLIQINMKGRHYKDFETRFYYGACQINMDASAKHMFLKFNWMPDYIKNTTLGRKKFEIEVEHYY